MIWSACITLMLPSQAALKSIDRAKMSSFLEAMCIPPERGGGFSIHKGGEGDLRACYLAMAVAHMLCLDKEELVRRSSMVQYVQRCQVRPHAPACGLGLRLLPSKFLRRRIRSMLTYSLSLSCPSTPSALHLRLYLSSTLRLHNRRMRVGWEANPETRRTAATHSAAWRRSHFVVLQKLWTCRD